jgi:hypothetical protein
VAGQDEKIGVDGMCDLDQLPPGRAGHGQLLDPVCLVAERIGHRVAEG